MRTKLRIRRTRGVRTTLELPDLLFARLKVRAASERVTSNSCCRPSWIKG